jgi:hypothetical protein
MGWAADLFIVPSNAPLLAAMCFALALAAWWLCRDAATALILGFAFPFAIWWLGALVWIGLEMAFYEYPVVPEAKILYVEAIVAMLLFLTCWIRASDSTFRRVPLVNPARDAGLLVAATTLHFHIVFSWLFKLYQQPLPELRLLRSLLE